MLPLVGADVTTFAQERAQSGRRLCYYVTIEGVGYGLSSGALGSALSDGSGLARFWTRRPGYVTSALLAAQTEMQLIHREVLLDVPDVLSERVDVFGGFPDLGEISFGVLDQTDHISTYSKPAGFMTHLLRLTAEPATNLTSSLTTSSTSVPVGDGTLISSVTPDNLIFVNAEAMRVTSIATNTATVVRSRLGTAAQTHASGDPVYTSCPYVHRRIVKLYVAPYGATSISQDTLLGEYVLDSLRFDSKLGAWLFTAVSISRHLDRKAPIKSEVVRADTVTSEYAVVSAISGEPLSGWRIWTGSQADSLSHFYVENAGEIMTATGFVPTRTIRPVRRGLLGSARQDIQVGSILRRVFTAEYDQSGDFRYSPNRATTYGDADWVKTAHWVDIILAIMTSSSDADDGLLLANYDASYPNFSWLPSGYGLGLPASKIDWAGWMAIKARTPDYLFPWFVYGRTSEPFGELITREFLKPIGAYVTSVDGVIELILPRLPWAGSTTVTIGSSDILAREVGRGVIEPDVEISLTSQRLSGRVEYLVGPQQVPWSVSDREYAATFGSRNYYAHDDRPITIEVPGADPNRASWIEQAATSRLYRARRPLIGLSAQIDLGAGYSAALGSVASVTLQGAPNFDGTRDWASQYLEVEEREYDPRDASYRIRASGSGVASQIRRICPAAWISQTFPGNIATCEANRFTESDGDTLGLPVLDAAAFSDGDVVRLYNPNGSLASSGTQIVTDVTLNDITLDGDFSGALAAGLLIVYAHYSEAVSSQTTGWAFESANVGSTIELSRYGER